MGQAEQRILKDCYITRRPIPDRINNAPRLTLGLEFYYAAFNDLSTCRDVGMGMGPIPWTEVQAYADSYGLSEDESDDLHVLMALMDKAFLKHFAQKSLDK